MDNKDLLNGVIEDRLNDVTDYDIGSEPHAKAHKEAMDCLDRDIEFEKIADKRKELELKEKELEYRYAKDEKELNLKQDELNLKTKEFEQRKKSEFWTKVIDVAKVVVPVVSTVAVCLFDFALTREIQDYERTGIYANSPGRMLSKQLFRRKH